MTHNSSFNIRSANDFLEKMIQPQYQEFLENNASSRHALLTIILVYHMYEWVHHKPLSQPHFASTYPDDMSIYASLDMARKISNGTKHFRPRADTQVQVGFSSGFSDGFARPLNVSYPNGRKQSVDKLLREIVDFWQRHKQMGAF